MRSEFRSIPVNCVVTSSNPPAKRRCVMVCQHRSCERNYSPDVLAALQAIAPPGVLIASSGCLGQCGSGPTVQVMPDQTWYCRVKPEDASEIVESHLKGDRPVRRLLHPRFHPDEAIVCAPASSTPAATNNAEPDASP